MSAPEQSCDLIMKGGITSGVVYSKAIVMLSQKYRFRNVGGTSAGAIAAVVMAAAEYGRADGGFEKIEALPKQLSATLLERFQPRPELRPVFNLLLAVMTPRSPMTVSRPCASDAMTSSSCARRAASTVSPSVASRRP